MKKQILQLVRYLAEMKLQRNQVPCKAGVIITCLILMVKRDHVTGCPGLCEALGNSELMNNQPHVIILDKTLSRLLYFTCGEHVLFQ